MPNEPGVTPESTPQAPPAPGATPTTPTQPAVTPTAPPGVTPDTAAHIRKLESDLASANAHIETLKAENIERRKASKIADDDRAELIEWRKLGEKPAVVSAELETGRTAITTAATLEREKQQSAAAALLKLKPSALSAKWLGEGVPTIEGEGTDKATVVIVDGEKRTAWDDFVAANQELADVLPALRMDASANGGSGGTPFVAQASGQAPKAFDEAAARKAQAPLYQPNNF